MARRRRSRRRRRPAPPPTPVRPSPWEVPGTRHLRSPGRPCRTRPGCSTEGSAGGGSPSLCPLQTAQRAGMTRSVPSALLQPPDLPWSPPAPAPGLGPSPLGTLDSSRGSTLTKCRLMLACSRQRRVPSTSLAPCRQSMHGLSPRPTRVPQWPGDLLPRDQVTSGRRCPETEDRAPDCLWCWVSRKAFPLQGSHQD